MAAGTGSTRKRSRSRSGQTSDKRSAVSKKASSVSSHVSAAGDQLVRGVFAPLNAVLLTRRHIEEIVDDAVMRGRMTRDDAHDMMESLLQRGAKAADELLGDVERVLGRAGKRLLESPPGGGGQRREPPGDRRAGVTAGPPIAGYDELSAAQVQEKLEQLGSAELRRLRNYERRHANRKTVLDRIERRLR